ncbi:MAG: thiamine pyrophosphate-dependent enzyme [Deltaproteobacteria bacterium]|jgi:pyruvate ferredoxin oxidoreductase beta subunit|nr:thiamine pyrophosphate-dependent enzyme [Deltaproteobacteria bacterium]
MEYLNVYASKLIPERELFASGHKACQGCAPALALRYLLKAAGPNTIVCNATGCMEIISSAYPDISWGVPWIHVAFENAAAVASGVEAGIKALQRKGKISKGKVNIIAIGGDGATFDIGMGPLSGLLERGHDVLYLCYDNEAYMNTGIQRSSGTPKYASTTTSPAGDVIPGQQTVKKDLAQIAIAHQVSYVATASTSYPVDFIEKVKKALATDGAKLIHIFAPCPTGWRAKPKDIIKLGRLAVQTGLFPIYEYCNGRYKMTFDLPFLKSIKYYLKIQGRYRHLTEEMIKELDEDLKQRYRWLETLARETKEAK